MAHADPIAVEVRDLVKVYPRPGGGTLRALDGISFEVRAGEFFGFLGPNGAGKTTALEIIEGIRRPTSGEVRVLGIDPRRELDRVKRVIGVQLQAASARVIQRHRTMSGGKPSASYYADDSSHGCAGPMAFGPAELEANLPGSNPGAR